MTKDEALVASSLNGDSVLWNGGDTNDRERTYRTVRASRGLPVAPVAVSIDDASVPVWVVEQLNLPDPADCRAAAIAKTPKMGGSSGEITPELRDEWMDKLDEAFDANTARIAIDAAKGHLDDNVLDYDGVPHGKFSKVGLRDSEGRHAAADYFKARLGLNS